VQQQHHIWSSALLSVSVSTVALVTLKFQANKHPPLTISPHPVRRLPAPLTPPPAKNEATYYTVLCSLVDVYEEPVSSNMRVWSQYVGNYLMDYTL